MADKILKFIFYNSTSTACDKCDFICDLINKYDPSVVLLQET